MKFPWTKKEPSKIPPKFCELDGCALIPIEWYIDTTFDKQTGNGTRKYVDGLICSKAIKLWNRSNGPKNKVYSYFYHNKWPRFDWNDYPVDRTLIKTKAVEPECD